MGTTHETCLVDGEGGQVAHGGEHLEQVLVAPLEQAHQAARLLVAQHLVGAVERVQTRQQRAQVLVAREAVRPHRLPALHGAALVVARPDDHLLEPVPWQETVAVGFARH